MPVQVTTEFLFQKIGALYTECQALTAENEALAARIRELEGLSAPNELTEPPTGG